ncbi:hypothetical protein SASPL_142142 [Salvia splendens]|uniref:Uncharacterized protein n=1 Tax=Salvia splendens TaxID=180675 RepID=A0A8X8WJ96_SALSN|nr:hypothetical protein SASPL_142142 [Salvia splendens]
MGRPPCCDKANVKRGPWTPEEDAKILAYVTSHGIGNWTLVPQKADAASAADLDGLTIYAPTSNTTASHPKKKTSVTRFGGGSSRSCEAPTLPTSPFSCNEEYILECKNMEMVESGNELQEDGNVVSENEICVEKSGSAADTFVEDMLARDMEIRLQFL